MTLLVGRRCRPCVAKVLHAVGSHHSPVRVGDAASLNHLVRRPTHKCCVRRRLSLRVGTALHAILVASGPVTLAGGPCHGLIAPTRGLAVSGHPCKQLAHKWLPLAHRQHCIYCQSLQQTRRTVLHDSISLHVV
ncbi:hypothetical protein B296_00019589 [Ensete ventricosum]|uniref:Uncharacterized protein n=1 Tax=Ensete ventricosum TaxID=4639 RepID=A0A426ZAJ6_ENSVE|nr:hypothetical protein B296_00019589 [Ensete ventricosum]